MALLMKPKTMYRKLRIIGSPNTELLCAVMDPKTSVTRNEYIRMTELVFHSDDPWVHAVSLDGSKQKEFRLTPISVTRSMCAPDTFFQVHTEYTSHILHKSCQVRIQGEAVSLTEWYHRKPSNMTSVDAAHYLKYEGVLQEKKTIGIRPYTETIGMVEMEVEDNPFYNNDSWVMLRDGLLVRI